MRTILGSLPQNCPHHQGIRINRVGITEEPLQSDPLVEKVENGLDK